jgi:hypothetical protein
LEDRAIATDVIERAVEDDPQAKLARGRDECFEIRLIPEARID